MVLISKFLPSKAMKTYVSNTWYRPCSIDVIKFLKLYQFSVWNRHMYWFNPKASNVKGGNLDNHTAPPRHTDFKIGYLAMWKCLIFHISLHLKNFIHLFIGPALHLSRKYQSYHLLWRRETIYLIFTLNMSKPTRETVGIWLEWLQPFFSSLGHVICKPLAYVKECFTSGNLSPLRDG